MKSFLLLILVGFSCLFSSAQPWTSLSTGCTSNFKSVHFPSSSTGYACGDNGKIIKTTNAGASWLDVSGNFPGYWFWDIHFVNDNLGYVVGESDPGMNPCGLGIILKTTDGGASWITLAMNLSFPVRDLFVLNKDTLFVCGGAESNTSLIEKSTNGGTTWTTVSIPYYDAMLGGMYFLNANTGFLGMYESVYGMYNPTLTTWLSTTNGGTSFTSNVVPGSASYWNFATDFPDALHGYMSRSTYVNTMSVYLRKTADGGNTWTESAIPSFAGCIYGLDFVDASTGYIVGASGVIMKTTNGGTSWTAQTSTTTQELRSVFFVNPNLGFAAGANGTMLRMYVITGIPETARPALSDILYPNPTKGILQFKTTVNNCKLEIYNNLGQNMISQTSVSANISIDISAFPPGVYTAVFSGQAGRFIQKLVKE